MLQVGNHHGSSWMTHAGERGKWKEILDTKVFIEMFFFYSTFHISATYWLQMSGILASVNQTYNRQSSFWVTRKFLWPDSHFHTGTYFLLVIWINSACRNSDWWKPKRQMSGVSRLKKYKKRCKKLEPPSGHLYNTETWLQKLNYLECFHSNSYWFFTLTSEDSFVHITKLTCTQTNIELNTNR